MLNIQFLGSFSRLKFIGFSSLLLQVTPPPARFPARTTARYIPPTILIHRFIYSAETVPNRIYYSRWQQLRNAVSRNPIRSGDGNERLYLFFYYYFTFYWFTVPIFLQECVRVRRVYPASRKSGFIWWWWWWWEWAVYL